jgi:hypothetical protein
LLIAIRQILLHYIPHELDREIAAKVQFAARIAVFRVKSRPYRFAYADTPSTIRV